MSRTVTLLATAAVALGAMAFASPAAAVVTTFASFRPLSPAMNVRFVNSGNSPTRLNDGVFYSTTTGRATTPGAVEVRFSFLQPALASLVNNARAMFTLNAEVAKGTLATGSPSFTLGSLSGSFSFTSMAPITVGTTTYAAGSNLLTVTSVTPFTNGAITGTVGGTSGSAFASTLGGSTLVYTSDFLNFSKTVDRDFSLSLTAVSQVFAVTTGANKAIRSFRANAGGQFSSNPAPLVVAIVPEPEIWGMLVVGFGLVGFQARRRKTLTVAA